MPKLIRASLIGLWLLWMVGVSVAQDDEFVHDIASGIQEYSGMINDSEADEIIVYVDNLEVGDILYALAIGDDDVDPYLVVTDNNGTSSLAQNNNGGGGVNAALIFEVEADGNYILGMFSVEGTGAYRMMVGVNDSSVIPDDILESGSIEGGFNISENETFIAQRDEVQRFAGIFNDDDDEIYVVFADLDSGDVIYVYAAGLGFVDPYIEILDQSLTQVYADDDDSGGGYNSVLSYEVESAGTYIARMTTLDQIGNYEITAGVNTPEILALVDAPTTFNIPEGSFDCTSIDQLGSRPNLTGLDLTREGDTYIIHYTLEGVDATTEEYIDAMQEAIDRSLDVQFNDLGWAVPPPDCGEGGDGWLDIYVVDLINSPAIGVAVPEGVVGDNPATERQEFFATYSYLLVDNDMDFVAGGIALDLMSATVAHEIHHNIQFGYDFNDSYIGFYEAGATWIETLVYPATNTVYEYVDDVFERPDVCIGRRSSNDLREYGEWLMIDSFTRDLGIESYQFIWEFIGTRQGLPGFYDALRAMDTSPQEVIKRMAIRNLLLDYALAKRFPSTVFIEERITRTGFVSPERNGVQELGIDYLSIAADRRYAYDITNSDDDLTMFAIGIDSDNETAQVFDLGRRGTFDSGNFDYSYLIIMNTREHTDSENCEYTDWTIQVSGGSSAPEAIADDEIWNASQFIPVR